MSKIQKYTKEDLPDNLKTDYNITLGKHHLERFIFKIKGSKDAKKYDMVLYHLNEAYREMFRAGKSVREKHINEK